MTAADRYLPTATTEDVLLTATEVSALTTLAPGTLYGWRQSGKGPKSIKFGRRVVWRRSEVLAWIAAQEQS